ncbi:MAG: hypothetical protein AAGC84_16885, partial [Pseudomonas sp.]
MNAAPALKSHAFKSTAVEAHNPIGTDGFEFVEYTAPTAEGIQQLRELFTAMGFTETAKH